MKECCYMLPIIAVYRVIKEFVPDLIEKYENDYETRLKAQKIMYLFEQFLNDDSYGYSWYLAGPYSSKLTHQLYDELFNCESGNLTKEWENITFTPFAQKIIDDLHEFINDSNKINNSLPDYSRFELLASIWYLAINSPNDRNYIKDKLLLNKPHFKNTLNLDELIDLVCKYIDSNVK